jgi:hypothetical protein
MCVKRPEVRNQNRGNESKRQFVVQVQAEVAQTEASLIYKRVGAAPPLPLVWTPLLLPGRFGRPPLHFCGAFVHKGEFFVCASSSFFSRLNRAVVYGKAGISTPFYCYFCSHWGFPPDPLVSSNRFQALPFLPSAPPCPWVHCGCRPRARCALATRS